MSDYKSTLNLPHTTFAMKADLAKREPERLKHWQQQDLYAKIKQHMSGQPKFILHDGPPYANGPSHLGHAVNRILKDIVVRSKTLAGFNVPFVPGWDCHGLPIELNVEKKYGRVGGKLNHREFMAACRTYAASQIDLQRNGLIRMGLLGDWQNPYRTMDFAYEADIVRSFAQIIKNGHLDRGYKPVHWCLDCQSSLSEAEVEYAEKTSPTIDVRFTVVDEATCLLRFSSNVNQPLGEGPISLPIWTTTPWTLPANQAVAMNATQEYALIQCQKDGQNMRLILAVALVLETMQRYEINEYRTLATCSGQALEGLQVQHPFYEHKQVPVILGDHVTMDAGTGIVHTAPGHGTDDYAVGMTYQLPVEHAVGSNGVFDPELPLFGGMHIFKANEAIINHLKIHNNLLQQRSMSHSYPHCWRHKTPVIFRATPQWFISMQRADLRQRAVEAALTVQFTPDWGKERLVGMLLNRPDWCISRQRTWGVPLALFIHRTTGELHPNTLALLEQVANRIEQSGIEAWLDLDAAELLGADAIHYEKSRDVLDVWFDSGVSHTAVLRQRPELQFPADLYLEGSDQHRGWFHTALLSSVAMYQKAPYSAVLTHGFTVDANGRKMSKSLGNGIEPDQVINARGADVLRLWVAATDYRAEMTVSNEILERTSDMYRRIRNTARFLLANLTGFSPSTHLIQEDNMLALDRFILAKARQLQHFVRESYERYDFQAVCQEIHDFCTNDLGSIYLDIIKDRQYTMPTNSLGRRSAQTALYHILQSLVRALSPILPFTTAEIWDAMPEQTSESLFLSPLMTTASANQQPQTSLWYAPLDAMQSAILVNGQAWDLITWDRLMTLRSLVNKTLEQQRAEGQLGSALEASVTLYVSDNLHSQLTIPNNELRFVFITSEAKMARLAECPATALRYTLDSEEIAIEITPLNAEKCERCWHRTSDIGHNLTHPTLCNRCITNISSDGELRVFA